MLSGTGNIDRVGRYGGARVYIPSKVAFDSALPFKMGEDVKIEISPETKTLLVVPADDRRSLVVVDIEMLKEISSILKSMVEACSIVSKGTPLKNQQEIINAEQKLKRLVLA